MKKGLARGIPLLLTLGGVILLLGSFNWFFSSLPACDICVARAERAAERETSRAAANKWTEAFASVHPAELKAPAGLELRLKSPPAFKPPEHRIF